MLGCKKSSSKREEVLKAVCKGRKSAEDCKKTGGIKCKPEKGWENRKSLENKAENVGKYW